MEEENSINMQEVEMNCRRIIKAAKEGKYVEVSALESEAYVLFSEMFDVTERIESIIANGLRGHPDSLALKIHRVRDDLMHDRMEKAKAHLAEIEYYDPETRMVRFCRGFYLLKSGRPEEGIAIFDRLIAEAEEGESKSSIQHHTGKALRYAKRYAEAVEYLKNALVGMPADMGIMLLIAACYRQMGELETAIRWYKDFLDEFPYFNIAWEELGKLYCSLKRYDEALECYKNVIAIVPDDPGSYREMMELYRTQGDFEKVVEVALDLLQRTEGKKQDMPLAYLVNSYAQMHEYEKTIEYARLLLKLDRKNPSGWQGCGYSLYYLKKYGECIPYLEKLVEMIPEDVNNWILLGLSYVKEEMREAAGWAFKHVLALDPYQVEANSFMANFYKRKRNIEEAMTHYLRLYEVNPKFEKLSYTIAQLYYALGEIDETVFYLTEAMKDGGLDVLHQFLKWQPEARYDLADMIEEYDPDYDPDSVDEEE